MTDHSEHRARLKSVRMIVVAASFLVVVVVLLIWLAGGFHRKIDSASPPTTGGASAESDSLGSRETVPVRVRHLPRVETAVGTVRPVHETAVASKLLAKVVEVNVTAGQRVAKGEVLMKLDDADLAARLQQAEAAAAAARSVRDQAQIEYDRIQQLVKSDAASKIEWDRVQSALKTAEADLRRAEQAVREAETVLSYCTIRSPIDGIVVDKRVEVGDTASPGEVLLKLFDPTRMQMVASVRESLARRLEVGQMIGVRVETLDYTCDGKISEIVPEAEAASRTFSVKVTGPCPPGVYPGMFGRILIPLDMETILVIPRTAVKQVGQLELVGVVEDGRTRRRAIKLGRTFDEDVEVLSGLREGERVVKTLDMASLSYDK
jgi:RND family efflux transporter MFP subunit